MKSYLFVTSSNDLLSKSSSGGAFGEIALSFIKEGGIVYGATINYDNHCMVEHKRCSTPDDIYTILGSKYVMSNLIINSTFLRIFEDLMKGLKVLFVGVPCQISSIYSFLNSKNCPLDNFFTIRLICHGAPQVKYYKQYINFLEKKYKSKIIHLNFRDKSSGWETYSFTAYFENGKKISSKNNKDPYLFLFLENYTLFSNCFSCESKRKTQLGDIILGDFWNVDKTPLSSFKNEKGNSLVLANSDKASFLLSSISNQLIEFNIDELDNYLRRYNPAFYSCVSFPKHYSRIVKLLNKKGIMSAYKRVKLLKLLDKIRQKVFKS